MSKIEVNAVEPQCGTTLTLGASGDTVTLGSGASQSGFGRTGTVDWQTTPKTSSFTAANGEGYFCNTTSSAFTMTMPSGSAGAIVSIQDYNRTFATNNLTVAPASGEKINGGNASQNLVINTEGQGLTFVYVDSTVGWKTVHENEFASGGTNFIDASGGTITTSGNCRIHTFTGPGTFTVNKLANCSANNVVGYMVVAGGGSGGSANNNNNGSGGAGAGGFREGRTCSVTPYTISPLGVTTGITVTQTSFPITVGAGGAAVSPPSTGNSGSNSIFSTITSAGGAGGASNSAAGNNGGSGSGGAGSNPGGNGNTPPVSPPQGSNGSAGTGSSGVYGGGGGGGATTTGTAGSTSSGGPGGTGATTHISGSPTAYAGGGAGGAYGNGPAGTGGTGGGGDGNDGNPANPGTNAGSGTANTGGGGGGNNQPAGTSGAGGSGVVIIRYKYQ